MVHRLRSSWSSLTVPHAIEVKKDGPAAFACHTFNQKRQSCLARMGFVTPEGLPTLQRAEKTIPMAAAAHSFSPDVEAALAKQPGLKASLDEAALQALARADPTRAAQVVEDLTMKVDVRNPSAFISSTLAQTPALRTSTGGSPAESIQELLRPHPDLQKALDEGAMKRLAEVGLQRATEVIDELIKRPDVRNPSAFVVHALSRTTAGTNAASVEDVLEAFPTVAARLDDRAQMRVRDSDPVRAKEILNEILNRGDLQNPSAFVMKSLGHTRERHDGHGPTGLTMQERDYLAATQVETLLSGYPNLRSRLDGQAIRRMRESDLTRVQEILQEMDSRGDVRNPSAFVVKALADHSALRRPETSLVGAEHTVAAPALLAAQYMLAAQAAQAQLLPQLAIPGLTGLTGLTSQYSQLAGLSGLSGLPGLAASQIAGLTAPQLAAAQLTPQLTPPGFFLPAADPLQQMLALHPAVAAQLDERAMSSLQATEPARAVQVLEEIVTRGDVQNPSAYVAASLSRGRPEMRTATTLPGDPAAAQALSRSRFEAIDVSRL
eukprot:s755_g9.t1